MQSTSALYQSILSSRHRFEVKVSIAGTDYDMSVLTALKTSRSAFGSGTPEIGLAAAGEISLALYAESASIPRMAELRPYVRVVNDSEQSEWIAKGIYYVDTREYDPSSGLLTLNGYDAMLRAERKYPASSLSWPARDIDVVNEIAAFAGFTVDARTTSRMTAAFRIPLPAQYTMRETLRYIAALYGGSFILTDAGALRLICLWDRKSSADLTVTDVLGHLSTPPAFPACTGVRFLVDDDTEVSAGNTNGYVYEITSPFATNTAAVWCYSKMRNFVYRPFTAETAVLDPAAEIGDTLSISGSLTSLFSQELTFDSLCASTVAAPEDEELDHEYPYESSQERSFTRKIKNVESELSIQAEQISARVTKTGGQSSSFGWYLDADKFQLMSDGAEVMRVDDTGLTIQGTVNATAGNIGGCTIQNGTLKIANANIDNINASKITAGTLNVARIGSKSITGGKIDDKTITSGKLDDGSVVNRVISDSAVSYGKTSFTGTLDQVGTNKANIDTINGYFTGSANFNALLAASIALNTHYLSLETITIGGVNRKVVTWT